MRACPRQKTKLKNRVIFKEKGDLGADSPIFKRFYKMFFPAEPIKLENSYLRLFVLEFFNK